MYDLLICSSLISITGQGVMGSPVKRGTLMWEVTALLYNVYTVH